MADTSVKLTQFFATGTAAQNLAKRREIRGYFTYQAEDSVKAALSGSYSYDDSSKKLESIWIPDGKTINQANQERIRLCMMNNNISGSISSLVNARTRAERDAVLACLGV